MSTENTNNTGVETQVQEPTTTEEVKTYTQEEVLALLQSEADKRVTAALKKQQAKYEKQLQDQVSLAKLDGDAREIADLKNQLAAEREKNAAFQIERNKSELKSVLSARGLSAEFADILAIDEDIEASQANIDKLDKLFKAAVTAEVEKRLAGSTPKGNGTIPAASMTKEAFMKMNMRDQQAWKNANPELYAKLYN